MAALGSDGFLRSPIIVRKFLQNAVLAVIGRARPQLALRSGEIASIASPPLVGKCLSVEPF